MRGTNKAQARERVEEALAYVEWALEILHNTAPFDDDAMELFSRTWNVRQEIRVLLTDLRAK